MIYTRMGNGVRITKANVDGTVDYVFLGHDDGRRGVAVYELFADGGIKEISEEINRVLAQEWHKVEF